MAGAPLTRVVWGAGRVSRGAWGSLASEQPKGQVCGWQEVALTAVDVGLSCSGCRDRREHISGEAAGGCQQAPLALC